MKKNAVNHFEKNYDSFLEEMNEFLAIPSVSTDPEHEDDVQAAAGYLAQKLTAIGMENVTVFQTNRHPIVYADYLHAGAAEPTILIYGHYDVQPEDPIDLWDTPPFTPTVIGDHLYARGASDMKGQVFACIAAIQSIKETSNLPVNIKFILEGEEEIGSPNLPKFLEEHVALLKADCALNTDAGMLGKNLPSITYGLRGLAYFELRLFGPNRDLHSGSYGGVVHNPAQVLVDLLSKMHDENGRVTLEGFYNDVLTLSETERKNLAMHSPSDEEFKTQLGVAALWGEAGFTPVERQGARPTLEINGILSGFAGKGSKTIIPAQAMAKISTRLVPNQNPEKIFFMLDSFIKKNLPPTVRYELDQLSTGFPSISDTNLPDAQALTLAFRDVWGVEPALKREGGSVPVVADMQKILGIDSVLTGFGLPDDRIHSPNEKLDLPTWRKGVHVLIHFFFNSHEVRSE
ncbi:MAG: dipeptidase [Anaerolineaceae bacterium]|nr:dipeptidase [Anaerolineaceae bacterium]